MTNTLRHVLTLVFLVIGLPSLTTALAEECRDDSDCPRNYICLPDVDGEGVCVWDSRRECDGNGDCPTGSTCINGTCSDGNPGDSCDGNGDCSTGYVCCDGHCRLSNCNDWRPLLDSDEQNQSLLPTNPKYRRNC